MPSMRVRSSLYTLTRLNTEIKLLGTLYTPGFFMLMNYFISIFIGPQLEANIN